MKKSQTQLTRMTLDELLDYTVDEINEHRNKQSFAVIFCRNKEYAVILCPLRHGCYIYYIDKMYTQKWRELGFLQQHTDSENFWNNIENIFK